jgi:hypothetical protein
MGLGCAAFFNAAPKKLGNFWGEDIVFKDGHMQAENSTRF